MTHKLTCDDGPFEEDMKRLLAGGYPRIPGPWAAWHDGEPFAVAVLAAVPSASPKQVNALGVDLLNRFARPLSELSEIALTKVGAELSGEELFLRAVVESVQGAIDAMLADKTLPVRLEPSLVLSPASPATIEILYRLPPRN